jgi:hypothetical protein
MLGKLFAAPFRLLNVPMRASEKLLGDDESKEDRILSAPLEAVAESVEEAIDGEDDS